MVVEGLAGKLLMRMNHEPNYIFGRREGLTVKPHFFRRNTAGSER
jgi:hypothetical protein